MTQGHVGKVDAKVITRPVRPNLNELSNMYFIDGLIWALPKTTLRKN